MMRILLTGMSGTGKSTLIHALAARGYKAVDTDTDAWSEWVTTPGDPAGTGTGEKRDWVWREDRLHTLLATEDGPVLFVSGCKSNQGAFYPQFDHIVLLSAPTPVLLARLATRTTNAYGKHPDERRQILEYIQTVEPLLRRTASVEIDTSAPLAQVIEAILGLLPDKARTGRHRVVERPPRPAKLIRGPHSYTGDLQKGLMVRHALLARAYGVHAL